MQGIAPTFNDGSLFGASVHPTSGPISSVTNGDVGFRDSIHIATGGIMTIALAERTDIDQINSYTSWRFDRIDQRYTVLSSTNGVTYTPIPDGTNVNQDHADPDVDGEQLVELTSLGLTGVTHLRWDFSVPQPAGFAAYSEFAAFGSPSIVSTVPEPSTLCVLVFGSLGVWVRRQRSLMKSHTELP
ncbi:hypothetical protein Fuma_02602 [Fuerstiella marisgermanici]|uniref:Ice-binding protein C-terminal domain-containing protein n=1 Tax=Fuerstiella marisgermanici TaxID=1891926 RepID=A0A1P8WG30_9PLAN|nr:hypothetical protein Fuma_02602 [Fuerstiella marisgermanici]